MAVSKTSLFLSSLLFFAVSDGVPCQFSIPNADNTCSVYDLSALSSPSGYWANATDFDYLINVCENISPSAAPSICSTEPHSPGYQIASNTLCISLGALSSNYSNALTPNGKTGLKVLYYNGDSQVINTSRSFLISFICDSTAGHGNPVFVQQTDARYDFTWRSAAACPTTQQPTACPVHYDANWNSLSLRPLPGWFDDAKFGIFLHWGLYSVPAYKTEWYVHQLNGGKWGPSQASPVADFVNFHNRVYGCSGVEPTKYPCEGAPFTFADFEPMFKAELFDPTAWAALFKSSGARYVVLTSKHHEGYCLWPSDRHWNWNSVTTGPHRDLVGELTASVRAAGLVMGVYHSLREWYHPLYLQDNDNNCSTTAFVDQILLPSLQDLSQRYQPDVFWADGAGDAPCTHDSTSYWKAPEFISWLYNNASNKATVIVNNRWGTDSGGDYMTGGDRFTPGHLLTEKWESCFTVQRDAWGYDRTEDIGSYYNATGLAYQLVETVSCGGNLLLNVGPTADGRIMPAFQDRLLQLGAWLQGNGAAIYQTRPWRAQNDTAAKDVWYTQGVDGTVYAISFVWPASGRLLLTQPTPSPQTQAVLLGFGALTWEAAAPGLVVFLPVLSPQSPLAASAAQAWVVALSSVA